MIEQKSCLLIYYRYKLADELNTTYEVIKGIITSIGFGAKTEESYYEFFDFEILEVVKEPLNAIEKILYENDIPQSKWNKSVLIQNFVKEIKDCKKVVSKYFKEKYYMKIIYHSQNGMIVF